jgi:hypothetical protein
MPGADDPRVLTGHRSASPRSRRSRNRRGSCQVSE